MNVERIAVIEMLLAKLEERWSNGHPSDYLGRQIQAYRKELATLTQAK